MNIRFLLMFMITMAALQAHAQFRHIKGQTGIEISSGVSEHGQVYGIAVSRHMNHRVYYKLNFNYENAEVGGFDINTFLVDLSLNYTLFSINPQFFVNAVGGVSGLYEDLSAVERITDISGYDGGVLGGVELEFYLSPKMVLLINGVQRYYFQSELGNERWQASAGLKIVL